ncbi:carbamoyl phosphate synthase small subunit [candidate division WOR-3 bacterium]|uniref:Carbamoyl phosphate synthase small chain n=1 Tax=candidate division WOR-3 bacterium TaxID=2052148 RepID=A0A660SLS9_UNCW3|nr:MAG: carbamoyl phosphate synthase small subunit [candidate division WOR-3 bacterium]
MNGILCLEDGEIFQGRIFGHIRTTIGELCFNTSMSGYQEILTDPSYFGQIVVMSYPIIGNYGTNSRDNESYQPFLSGFIIREYCRHPSNPRMELSLSEFLKRNRVSAIEEIDTRALVRHIREKGEMRAAIAPLPVDRGELLKKVQNHPKLEGRDLVSSVTTKSPYRFGHPKGIKIVVYDFGVKRNILRLLKEEASVIVVPAQTDPETVLGLDPAGIILSNGPGDPAAVTYAIDNIKKLLGRVPILGICLGHQLLGLALGGRTYRLKFGHHGGNHPVKDLRSGKILITVQNHSFALDPASLERSGAEITHINLNDGTLEGFFHPEYRIYSYQFHPEASPGPTEANQLIQSFLDRCRSGRTSRRF